MRALGIVGAVFSLALAAAASAQPIVFVSPGRGAVLQAGTDVEVRWTGVPSNAEEVELLLSLDGGRTAALRLTDEISPRDRSYLWRVPNLSARNARLILRMGVDEHEIESPAGPAFQIAPLSFAGQALRLKAGELWAADQDEESARSLPDLDVWSSESSWMPAAGESSPADAPSPHSTLPSLRSGLRSFDPAIVADAASSRLRAATRQRHCPLPLRI